MTDGFMGKFFKAVESLSENTTDESRDKAIENNVMLVEVKAHVDDMYVTLRQYADGMRQGYASSKQTYNLLWRYGQWRKLIKELLRADAAMRERVKLPEQRDNETPLDYSMKIAAVLQRDVGRKKLTQQQMEKRYAGKSSQDINDENSALQFELHKTLKKYFILRSLVNTLETHYEDSKDYPIIPRYTMLKGMMKDMFRNPDYIQLLQDNVGRA